MLLFNPQNNTCFSIFRRYVACFDALCVIVWLLVHFLALFSMFCSQERLRPALFVVPGCTTPRKSNHRPSSAFSTHSGRSSRPIEVKQAALSFWKWGNGERSLKVMLSTYVDPILFPLHIISSFAARWRVSATSILGSPRQRILEIRESNKGFTCLGMFGVCPEVERQAVFGLCWTSLTLGYFLWLKGGTTAPDSTELKSRKSPGVLQEGGRRSLPGDLRRTRTPAFGFRVDLEGWELYSSSYFKMWDRGWFGNLVQKLWKKDRIYFIVKLS